MVFISVSHMKTVLSIALSPLSDKSKESPESCFAAFIRYVIPILHTGYPAQSSGGSFWWCGRGRGASLRGGGAPAAISPFQSYRMSTGPG